MDAIFEMDAMFKLDAKGGDAGADGSSSSRANSIGLNQPSGAVADAAGGHEAAWLATRLARDADRVSVAEAATADFSE